MSDPASPAMAGILVAAPPLRARSPAAFDRFGTVALKAAATSWFVVAVLGQLVFVAYVIGFYGRAALQGRFEAWNKVLPHGYVPGDTFGNLVVSLHLAFATIVIVGGAVQLVPFVRRTAPTVHRWNGRIYLASVLLMSVGGLVMVWTRGSVGDPSQHVAISINALLIIAFAGMTLRHALARRFDVHRRWALRLFLVVAGVWFFRIGLMAWIVVNKGPVGFDPKAFVGPFLTFLAFAQYVLPLAVLELYLRAQAGRGALRRVAVATVLFALTGLTATGIAAASMIMWLPRL